MKLLKIYFLLKNGDVSLPESTPWDLALDFRQGLAAFSTRLRAPKLYSTGGFAKAESTELHRNCHEFWLTYVRNT